MNKNFSGSLWGEYPPVKNNTPVITMTYKKALEDIAEYINNTPFDNDYIEALYLRLLTKKIKIEEDKHE